MFEQAGAEFTYRDYTQEPFSADEIRAVLPKLGMSVKDVLRMRDAVKAGFRGDEPDDVLIEAMAQHPRMLQRPIAILGDRAELGRPVENLARLLT